MTGQVLSQDAALMQQQRYNCSVQMRIAIVAPVWLFVWLDTQHVVLLSGTLANMCRCEAWRYKGD